MSQSLQAEVRPGIRKPIITLVIIIAIVLGVSAGTAVFSVVDGIRRLTAIWIYNTQQDQANRYVSYPNFADWRKAKPNVTINVKVNSAAEELVRSIRPSLLILFGAVGLA